MPELLQAVVLGIIQGLTEFLPVSSTAHLTLVPWLLGWDSPLLNSLTFDVALHMGTLVAVLVYFRSEWLQLIRAFVLGLVRRDFSDPWARLSWLVILGTLPAAIAGALLEKQVESAFRSPIQIALVMALFSVVFVVAERVGRQNRQFESLSLKETIAIGFGQALAIVPGVSRSGATISAGLMMGVDRASASRFSFLLSTPIIAGAGAKRLLELRHATIGADDAVYMLVGALAAGIFGWLCIRWLLAYLARDTLYVFVWYRIFFALLLAGVYFLRG